MRNAKLAMGLGAAMLLSGSLPVLAAQAPAAAPAPAQADASSRPGFSSNAPVDITADEAEVRNQDRITIMRGEVEALQGQNRLRTPQLTVYYAQRAAGAPASPGGAGLGAIERMEATGPVYFVTPTQTAKGDKGVYTSADDNIVLTGNVVLVQDRNVAKGDVLTINQKSGVSTLVSNAKGRGTSQRVRGVFYPNSAPADGAAAPATPGAKR